MNGRTNRCRALRQVLAGCALTLLAEAGAVASPALSALQGLRGDNGQIHACTGAQAGLAVWCVRAGAPPGGNGTAASPLATISAATSAAKAGDIVQVAAGIYAENVALGSYGNPVGKHLTLLGGFDSGFTGRDADANATIINGGMVAPCVQLHVNSSQTTTLDGFVLTNGRGLGTDWQTGGGAGGGVHVEQQGAGTTVISHNRIHGNRTYNHASADTRGGGIHAATPSWGGFTGKVHIQDNWIHDNEAGKGAAINVVGRHALIERNLVEGNTGHHDHGGGIYISTADTQVRDNVVRGNVIGATAGYGWGGGIIVAAAGADLQGNTITDNYTPTAGSGVYWDEGATGTMRNDILSRNRCPQGARSAAAIYVDGGPGGPSMVQIENVTIADHHCPGTEPDGAAVVVEGGSAITVRNAIFRGNSRDFATLSGGTVTVSYSITTQAGTGNFSADPLFANAAAGDYHLRSAGGRYTPSGWVVDAVTSPAIDAGDPASDYAQESQPNGGRVNLGAWGNTAQASRTPGGDLIFANGFQ